MSLHQFQKGDTDGVAEGLNANFLRLLLDLFAGYVEEEVPDFVVGSSYAVDDVARSAGGSVYLCTNAVADATTDPVVDPAHWSLMQFALATGGAPGQGTVTSVALSAPSCFGVSGSPITSSGTFTLTLPMTGGQLLIGQSAGAPISSTIGGDVTLTQSGVMTIAAGAVSFGKMASIAAGTVIGNSTGGTAVPQALPFSSIALSSLGAPAANIALSGFKFTGGADGVNASDFVTVRQLNNSVSGIWDDQGNYDASGNTFPATGDGPGGSILKGYIWTVNVAGVLGGVAAPAGTTVRALQDSPGQTAANWALGQGDLGYAPVSSANLTVNGIVVSGGGVTASTVVLGAGQILVGQASAAPQNVTLGGDATLAANGALTLNTVNGSPGSIGGAAQTIQITVNGKGLATSATAVPIAITSSQVSGLAAVATSGSASDLGTGTLNASRLPTSVPLKSAANTYTGGQAVTPQTGSITTGTTTYTPNFATSNNHEIAVSASGTISNPSGQTAGGVINLVLSMDSTGGYTIGFGTAYDTSAVTVNNAANAVTLLSGYCHSNGKVILRGS